ncbi:MAG: hypothetical protein LBU69_02690 [Deltaproteobacteria bacterium]|jgi:hypothetical protein|nr:hypothetical protein [Deltaproteobacteria bacterium]
MSSTATKVLFDELLKRPDDLDLFLALRDGFPEFHRGLCLEFFFGCLIPGLQENIDKYNAGRANKLELFFPPPDKRGELFAQFGGLWVNSQKDWDPKLSVYLISDLKGCAYFNAGVQLNYSMGDFGPLAKPFDEGFRECFNDIKNYKSGNKYVHCDYPKRDWNSREMTLAMARDVMALRKGEGAGCPTAERYVETLMALVRITDKVYEAAPVGGASGSQ